jgi:hypothetical protein
VGAAAKGGCTGADAPSSLKNGGGPGVQPLFYDEAWVHHHGVPDEV